MSGTLGPHKRKKQTNIGKLLFALSFLALLERDHGICFVSFVEGLATLEGGFGAIAVPAAGVAGSVKENCSASGAALERELRVVLGGILKKLRPNRL